MYEIERAKVKQIQSQIDNFECEIKIANIQIDWGQQKRQGKRIGNTIIGSMSNAPSGITTYQSVGLSEYHTEDTEQDLRNLNGIQTCKYYRARKFGCNHIEAMVYSVMKKIE